MCTDLTVDVIFAYTGINWFKVLRQICSLKRQCCNIDICCSTVLVETLNPVQSNPMLWWMLQCFSQCIVVVFLVYLLPISVLLVELVTHMV